MKKIVFEQVGNTIIAILLIIASCQTIITSKFNMASDSVYFEFNFNFSWILFIISLIIFWFTRLFYAKIFGETDGYNKKDGEFSVQDEREKIVASETLRITYRVLIYYLMVSLMLFLFISGLVNSLITLRIMTIVLIGSCLIVAFLTYLLSWIIFDNKI